MIQRIQSLYLLIAVVLLLWASFKPFLTFNGGEIILDGFKALSGEQKLFSTIPLNIILWLSALISFITIFLYKNRIRQMRLTVYTILILFGFYLLLGYYYFYGVKKYVDITASKIEFYSLLPLISLILIYMANRAIKRDEELVRSIERFR